jgi:dTDP-4-dehydrorhamnose 3,5-epimerase
MKINGLKKQRINSNTDTRGSFTRLYDNDLFTTKFNIKQINLSDNPKQGTLRGMHFQVSGPPEDKYINIISGLVYLVIVDLRIKESTYLNINQTLFSTEENNAIYIPAGCATGWLSLAEGTKLIYSMSSRYEDCTYGGFRYDDPKFSINWPSIPNIISNKDLSWPDIELNN